MRGGSYIPDTAKEKPTQGEVIAVGPGRYKKGERVPLDLKVGDTVLYGKYSGTAFTIDGNEVMIVKASEVLAENRLIHSTDRRQKQWQQRNCFST